MLCSHSFITARYIMQTLTLVTLRNEPIIGSVETHLSCCLVCMPWTTKVFFKLLHVETRIVKYKERKCAKTQKSVKMIVIIIFPQKQPFRSFAVFRAVTSHACTVYRMSISAWDHEVMGDSVKVTDSASSDIYRPIKQDVY